MTGPRTDADDQILTVVPDDDMIIGEIPVDIEMFMSEHNIGKQTYQCQIKRKPEDGGAAQTLPGIFKDVYPSCEDIGKKFGPGTYVFCFTWRISTGDGKKKSQIREHIVVLSAEWEPINRKYMRSEIIKERAQVKKIKQNAILEASLDGEEPRVNNVNDGVTGLKEAAHTLRDINAILAPAAGQVQSMGGNGDMGLIIQAMMQANTEASKTTMTLMMSMMKNSSDMMIAMMGNKPQSEGNNFKEAMEMVSNLVDLKTSIAPEKVTAVDKIFGVMEAILPKIIEVAQSRGMAAAKADPMVNMAKDSQQFKDIMGDPQQWQYMVTKLIDRHGINATNTILETMDVPLTVTENGEIIPKMPGHAQAEPAAQPEPPYTPPPGSDGDDVEGMTGE